MTLVSRVGFGRGSKETERDADWMDVAVLERILDARHLARVQSGSLTLAEGLAALRSRSGLEGYLGHGLLPDPDAARAALRVATHPVTQATLLPFVPTVEAAQPVLPIEPVIVHRLRTTAPASPLHLSLIEIVRRRYVQFRKDLDRADKASVRMSQT
jgi:hypothetical protein